MVKKEWPYYLPGVILLLFMAGPSIMADGTFLDGMIYAAVSRNLAEGQGTIWMPYYTANWTAFYEHPPLAFWLESLVFRLLGDTFYAERLYSVFMFVLTGWIIVLIWNRLTGATSLGWVPLSMWLLVPLVWWASPHNILENTMMVFTSLAILFYLNRGMHFLYLVLAGIAVFLAFLSKGVFSLFVWSVPFWFYVFNIQRGLKKMLFESIVIMLFTILPIFIITLFDDGIITNLQAYLTNQVVGSIQNVQTVERRFEILKIMMSELGPAILVAVIFLVVVLRLRVVSISDVLGHKETWAFMCIGLSGVVPIMVSMKQSGFYIMATFPVFAIALGLLICPGLKPLVIRIQGKAFTVFSGFMVVAFIAVLVRASLHVGTIGRDKEEMADTFEILDTISGESILSITPELSDYYQAHAQFQRYGKVTLTTGTENPYLITSKGNPDVPGSYKKVPIQTMVYDLYERE